MLIERREGPVRTLLNSHQLVQECNSFKDWVLDPVYKSVQCRCRDPAVPCWVTSAGLGGWQAVDCTGGHGAPQASP